MLFAADVCTNVIGLGDPVGFESLEQGRASQRKLASLSFDAVGSAMQRLSPATRRRVSAINGQAIAYLIWETPDLSKTGRTQPHWNIRIGLAGSRRPSKVNRIFGFGGNRIPI